MCGSEVVGSKSGEACAAVRHCNFRSFAVVVRAASVLVSNQGSPRAIAVACDIRATTDPTILMLQTSKSAHFAKRQGLLQSLKALEVQAVVC